MSVAQRIIDAINRYQANDAFCIADKTYSYQFLEGRIQAILECLKNRVSTGIIGIITNDEIDTYAAILACWVSGRTYVPIHTNFPKERNNYILEATEIHTVLNSGGSGLPFDQRADITIIDTTNEVSDRHAELLYTEAAPGDIAYILFTSGSTGNPKGVPIGYGNLEAFVEGFEELGYNIGELDRCLQMYELSFDLSIVSFLNPILGGACVYTTNNDEVKYIQVLKLITKYKLTVIQIVPSIIKLLKPLMSRINNESLRLCILGGEATDIALLPEFAKAFPNSAIYNMYGPTEATIYCATYQYSGIETKNYHNMFAIGKPMKHVQFIITDENNKVVKEERTNGELCISGDQLTIGYINSEEKNQTSFIEVDGRKFYKTGDMSFRDAEGDFYYCGRYDNQVKILGYRIELHEIEHNITKAIGLNNIVVLLESDHVRTIPELVLILESASEINEEEFYSKIKKLLPEYMIPARIVYLESFPINNSGKTDRKKIKEQLLTQNETA